MLRAEWIKTSRPERQAPVLPMCTESKPAGFRKNLRKWRRQSDKGRRLALPPKWIDVANAVEAFFF